MGIKCVTENIKGKLILVKVLSQQHKEVGIDEFATWWKWHGRIRDMLECRWVGETNQIALPEKPE